MLAVVPEEFNTVRTEVDYALLLVTSLTQRKAGSPRLSFPTGLGFAPFYRIAKDGMSQPRSSITRLAACPDDRIIRLV
jgi:hypothetical protein